MSDNIKNPGVDFIEMGKLGDLCEIVKGNTPIQKAVPGEYPLVVTSPQRRSNSTYQFDKPSVIIPLVSSRGHGVASLNQIFYQDGKFAVGNILACATPKHSTLDARYLCAYLNLKKDVLLVPLMTGGANVSLTVKTLQKANIQIPLPPLPIQQEIVRILDSFTSMITNLETELASRQKQYEYYRNKLLTFDENDETVEWKTINEVFDTRNGYTPSTQNLSFWENGVFPWFKMEDIREKGHILSDSNLHITQSAIKGKGLFKANSIILATSATIGEHALITVEHLSNQRFTNFYPKKDYIDIIDMKYMHYYFYVIDRWCKEHTIQGNFAGVNMSELYSYIIPIPSKERQQEIVSTLDTFESLISNIKQELDARKKQYEYYREKLLTFE